MAYKFEWDKGNGTKILLKHGISNAEAESVFEDRQRVVYEDLKHSANEKRYIGIGRSWFERLLIVCFTYRGGKIRIIGTRRANLKERNIYEKGS